MDHRVLIIAVVTVVLLDVCQAAASDNLVAFSAGLSSSRQVSENEVAQFDRIFTNIGRHYNPNTGIFTAPVAGTYVFHVSILSQQRSLSWLKLYQNLQYKISIYERDVTYFGGSGATVILQLKKNDQIYLKSAGSSYLYGDVSDVYSIFSGYLLFSE